MHAQPTLENFFAAYFHQDWAAEHATADAVIDDYRTSEEPDQVARAQAEAETLLGEDLDEAALGARVTALGCEYDPTREGQTWRGWLQHIAQRLAGAAH